MGIQSVEPGRRVRDRRVRGFVLVRVHRHAGRLQAVLRPAARVPLVFAVSKESVSSHYRGPDDWYVNVFLFFNCSDVVLFVDLFH